ncbi:MAG: NAD(P)-dependent alcohol dehydrogenase [Hellea sp.]|nr:NAD(P)-dependent alcohol dehydrogenase [Hellea sp.]
MSKYHGYAAMEAGQALQPYSYDPGPLADDQVEIDVIACGLCHSDVSMIDNEWGASKYPIVGGHEIIGRVSAKGPLVSNVEIGQTVGVGWLSGSCQNCGSCVSGSQHHCRNAAATIIRREGGFANKVRAQSLWTIPLPEGLDPQKAGPLFCGGITVFSPFVDFQISPTDKIAVVGIGGLGHLALKFANAWGCEVTAFTSSMDKRDELLKLGAHHVVNSKDNDAIKALKGRFDLVLSTVNVNLPWYHFLSALAPRGRLVQVGIVTEPMAVPTFSIITGQKSVSGSDTGSPSTIAKMLQFCARHKIEPQVEFFPMTEINSAIEHLKSGKARYRIVLTND